MYVKYFKISKTYVTEDCAQIHKLARKLIFIFSDCLFFSYSLTASVKFLKVLLPSGRSTSRALCFCTCPEM